MPGTMKTKTLLFSLMAAASTSLTPIASAALVEKTVEYKEGDTTLEGFQVYDDAVQGKRPAVLVIHQWTGLTDYEKMRARMLAELGYNVLAADIYGKGVRPQPPAAGQEAGKFKGDRGLYRARLKAGLDLLQKDERTDTKKIAAIGYCFGGTGVLELARSGADIAGVVSFHGALDAAAGMEAKPGTVKAKVLVLHGAEDPFVPNEQAVALGKELSAAGVDWQLSVYADAVHGFTQKMSGDDKSKGAAYNEKADKRSWEAMKVFFAEIFK